MCRWIKHWLEREIQGIPVHFLAGRLESCVMILCITSSHVKSCFKTSGPLRKKIKIINFICYLNAFMLLYLLLFCMLTQLSTSRCQHELKAAKGIHIPVQVEFNVLDCVLLLQCSLFISFLHVLEETFFWSCPCLSIWTLLWAELFQ